MAEYYGRLKDTGEKKWIKALKKTIRVVLILAVFILIISVLTGIFGDTKRLDETRAIVIENTELKEKVIQLEEENEALKKEVEALKNTLEENSLNVGTTLSKPEGDMSENISGQ